MTDEKSAISGNRVLNRVEEAITQFSPICGEGHYRPSEVREDTNRVRNEKMKKRNKQWKEPANAIGGNASILAGEMAKQ